MNTLDTILIYGIPCSLIISVIVMGMLWYNPRLFLQDYPKDIQAAVPPKTKAEKRVSTYWAIVIILLFIAFPLAAALSAKAAHHSLFEIFLSAFGVPFLFNTIDWLILDWLIG